MKRSKAILRSLAIFLLLSGCTAKKFVPEGELLYTGAKIEIESESEVDDIKDIKSTLKEILKPEPNSSFLGMRPGLWAHYKAQKEHPGFINKFLNKKIGEKPVYESDVKLFHVEDLINNRLENRGFFYSAISSKMEEKSKKKEAKAFYSVELQKPYVLSKYHLDKDSLYIYNDIDSLIQDSPISQGMRFNLSYFKLERERIDIKLKDKGYYNFNPSFLIFEADTSQYSNKKFDLFLHLKDKVPEKGIIPYKITQVNVYPDYALGSDSISADTVQLDGKNFIQAKEYFKPKRLVPFITLTENQKYSPKKSRVSARRLTSIGAYKFVNIRYQEIDSLQTDSLGFLKANIFLSPLNKMALRAELQGVTKSNNFAGPNLALTFSNRNLFKGGEIMQISAKVGYETQISGGNQNGLHSLQLGVNGDLIFPRLLFPISINEDWFEYAIPKTKISLGADYMKRSKLFSLGSISARFGYFWNANRFVQHEFNPISLNYVSLTNTTDEFQEILDKNPFLLNSFKQEFIAGLTYSFFFNQMVDSHRKNQFFINANLDLAGNTLSLISKEEKNGPNQAFGLVYAQYAKSDVDIRFHHQFSETHLIASRLFAGIGLPYGNSDIMPFSKQYFAGGPYSVRAFKMRSLGPGDYDPEEQGVDSYFDQVGNIRLEANLEYRFPLVSVLNGAVFADAGNVWLTKSNETLGYKGEFGSNFLNELGIGVGAGLRVDIQDFVIRVDLAAPIHDPRAKGERWNFQYKKPVLNFAIGYPF